MDVSNLSGFLASLAAGGGTFFAVRWAISNWDGWQGLSRRARLFVVYALSFGIATGAYGLQIWLGDVMFNPEALFTVCVTAFATSQALWGIFDANKTKPVTNDNPQ